MSVAIFDIISGMSGDMTIAALLDAGADFEYLKNEISKLPISGFQLLKSGKSRNQIHASKFDVIIDAKQHYHTHLSDIIKIIDSTDLSDFVKLNSKRIFETIGAAESKIHNIPLEKIHFHEVGAIDSIVDIVGACICIENLGITKIYSSPVKLGQGLIKTQHGIMPNPAPATLEILKDYPVVLTDINFELTTPSGAAIIKTLSCGVINTNEVNFKVSKIGFGSGTFDIEEVPNLLRVILGEIIETDFAKIDKLVNIETNIDDLNPQVYPFLMERLFNIGVMDVYYTQIIMKKGRPGIMLSVLTEPALLDNVLEILYSETTTLGVRVTDVDRHKLKREFIECESSFGKVNAKKVYLNSDNSGYFRIVPEFEECKRLALSLNIPLKDIYNQLYRDLNG
jgi:pyridinium-3,5-bisthiocarboxylic acid mononucleotide nickel chelatase